MFRCDFYAYCIFSLVNTVVYCVPAGWIWGSHGFLYNLGVVDIAGSGGVHLIGGVSGSFFSFINLIFKTLKKSLLGNRINIFAILFKAFVAAKTMGARLGRWDIEGDPPMGSPTNAVVGLFMLWWGWFAFNAGSTFGNI